MSDINMPKPKVIIDRMALEKIRYLVDKDSQECSGMGITRVVGDTIYVDDVKMLEQRNGAAHTDINEDAVTKLMYEWRDREGEINFWWHSHVNMGVFWSGTDEATIKQLAQHGMCVASVFNKKGEIRTAVACKIEVPFAAGAQVVMFDNLALMVQTQVPDAIKAVWDEEHTANVKKGVDYWSTRGNGYLGNGVDRVIDRWNRRAESREFLPEVTKDPDHWDTYNQGFTCDVDWIGCRWDAGPQKYRKSAAHMVAEAQWLKENNTETKRDGAAPIALPPPNIGDTRRHSQTGIDSERREVKLQFAMGRDEIVQYDPLLDMFILLDGSKIAADWYMGSDGLDFRRNKAAEADVIMDGKTTEELIQMELDALNMERDLGDPSVVPQTTPSEQDLLDMEDAWNRHYQD